MASSDGGSEVDNSAGTCQQLGTDLKIVPEEVTPVLEMGVMTVTTEARPSSISMLHDYAMDYLFTFLPMGDLKNCRLVNRYWNLVSNRTIQKRDFVIKFPIIPKGRAVPVPPAEILDDVEDIPKFVQEIRTSFQFPWTKFMLDARLTGTAGKEQLCNLLHVVSPFVTGIEIHDLHDLPSLEYPHLRKLKLWHDPTEKPIESNHWESPLKLVESASKLTDIVLTGPQNTPLFMDMLEIPNCRKITRLSLNRWIKGEHLVKLSEMGLQLKYLSLAFELTVVTAESLRAFLHSQSTCLEHLELKLKYDGFNNELEDELDEVDPRWRLGMEFPRLEKLKVLRVSRVEFYSRISYKEMFPVLKKLSFEGESYPVDSFFNEDIEPVETVEYLRLEEWSQHPSKRILQAAIQFPKLQSVFIRVNRYYMNILGHAMPQLEEMELEFNRDDDMDAVLTGFSFDEMKTLERLPIGLLDVLKRSKEPMHFLKNLKKLRISSKLPTAVESLTDLGCRFALLKMENLRVLELKGNFSQISDPVMERMRNKFVVRLEN